MITSYLQTWNDLSWNTGKSAVTYIKTRIYRISDDSKIYSVHYARYIRGDFYCFVPLEPRNLSDIIESTISEFYCSRNDRVRQKNDDTSIIGSSISINVFKSVQTVRWGEWANDQCTLFSGIQKNVKKFFKYRYFPKSFLGGKGGRKN